MKVGIITFHRAINYGAALQAFALYRTIERLGKIPELIDYLSPVVSSIHKRIKFQISPKALLRYLRYGRSVNSRFDKFARFIESMSLSPAVKELSEVAERYDAVICGSDQVWNLKITGEDFNYFLKGVEKPTRRIAYAASFGLSSYPPALKEEIIENLNKLSAISVRETVGQEIVESLIGRRPELVLDPTLLLTKAEWQALAQPYPIPEKYLLIYSVGQIEDLFGVAKEISKKYGWRIAIISHKEYRDLPGAIYLKDLSPLEFVEVVDKAECVITNSFHGTAFSVALEKRFIVVRRSETKNPGLNSRMETLLEKVDLSHQFYGQTTTDIDRLLLTDHSDAARRLERLRAESIDFLASSLAE